MGGLKTLFSVCVRGHHSVIPRMQKIRSPLLRIHRYDMFPLLHLEYVLMYFVCFVCCSEFCLISSFPVHSSLLLNFFIFFFNQMYFNNFVFIFYLLHPNIFHFWNYYFLFFINQMWECIINSDSSFNSWFHEVGFALIQPCGRLENKD